MKLLKKNHWFVIVILNIFLALAPLKTHAGVIPSCAYVGDCDLCGFVELIVNIAGMGLGIIGGVTLLFFVWGGLMLLLSAGNREKISYAKRVIGGTFMGLVMVLLSWTIVNFTIFALVGGNVKDVKVFGNIKWWEANCKKRAVIDNDKCGDEGVIQGSTSCKINDKTTGICWDNVCITLCQYQSTVVPSLSHDDSYKGYACKNISDCQSDATNISECNSSTFCEAQWCDKTNEQEVCCK